ncbi:MAG: sulfotransferase [Pseudoxanthomonas sp.]
MLEEQMRHVSALIQRGALAEAERHLLRLLAEFPDAAAAHRQMALLASSSGRHELALEHMAKACLLAPDSAEFHFQFGCLLAHSSQYEQALPHFKATTDALPDFADAWYFRGICLLRMNRDTEALSALRCAYDLAPDHGKALEALADVEFRVGYPADALPLWQRLGQLRPTDINVALKRGETYSRLGSHDLAISSYHEALRRSPDSGDLWMALAQAHEDEGNRQSAQQAYEHALALKPGWAFPLAGLLGLQRAKASDELIAAAIGQQQSPALGDPERALIGYELGKVHDGRGEFESAMSSWHDANAARQRMIGSLEPAWLAQRVDRTMREFDPASVIHHASSGCMDDRFVFIVGMPRSGTTLTEQIIASHPQAFGCGELPDIALIVRNLPLQLKTSLQWPEIASALDRESLLQAVDRYVAASTRHSPPGATRLVDKAPLNFYHLGLIAMMLPQARVIWCRRDPRDIAVSIYGENFSLEERLATSLASIGHYINQQNRLMRHWQSVLPIPILELQYEKLVSSIETESRRIIDFIGLPWDPACLDFHLSERGVQTPSRWQVKQPVHTRSIGRWRNYEPALEPLLEVLDPESY